jgi:hypothetical protein
VVRALCYGAVTHLAPYSKRLRIAHFQHVTPGRGPLSVLQPRLRNGCRLGTETVWASSRFARHYYGNAFSSSRY